MEVKDTSMRRSEIDANPIPCPFCKSDGDILEMRIESEFISAVFSVVNAEHMGPMDKPLRRVLGAGIAGGRDESQF